MKDPSGPAKSVPYIRSTVNLGYKGHLRTGKNRPLYPKYFITEVESEYSEPRI